MPRRAAEAVGSEPLRADERAESVARGEAGPERDAKRVAAMCRLIELAEREPDLEALAAHVGLSRFHAHRLFRRVAGVTPKAYAKSLRLERMRRALETRGSVTEAIYAAGYGSSGGFYADARERLGMTPSQYRAGGAACVVRYACGPCSLGHVLVASTERGVCALLLGDAEDALALDLARRFPHATKLRDDEGLGALLATATRVAEGAEGAQGAASAMPLDLRGTAFQQRVWQALRAIPAGETVSYAELAARLGAPNAARAVATACAANPVAIVVPCHRVVRSDGEISGYRWGRARKRALLDREATELRPARRR